MVLLLLLWAARRAAVLLLLLLPLVAVAVAATASGTTTSTLMIIITNIYRYLYICSLFSKMWLDTLGFYYCWSWYVFKVTGGWWRRAALLLGLTLARHSLGHTL